MAGAAGRPGTYVGDALEAGPQAFADQGGNAAVGQPVQEIDIRTGQNPAQRQAFFQCGDEASYIRRATLEDVFIKLTGRRIRD